MRWKLARCFQTLPRLRNDDLTEWLKLIGRDRPASQHLNSPISQRDNSRFNAVNGRSTVDDERDASIELVEHMLRARWADPPKPIGAGRSQRRSESANDFRKHRMRTDSDRHRFESGRNDLGNNLASRQHHGQWTGPELSTQRFNELSCVVIHNGDAIEPSEIR